MIPIRMGLLGKTSLENIDFSLQKDDGTLSEAASEMVLVLTEKEQSFVLHGVNEAVIPSLLRQFSAPIELDFPYEEAELYTLMTHDADEFVRWEAGQTLYRRVLAENVRLLKSGKTPADLPKHTALTDQIRAILTQKGDPNFRSLMLRLPSELELIGSFAPIDPMIVYQAHESLLNHIAVACTDTMLDVCRELKAVLGDGKDHYDPAMVGVHSLLGTCRSYLLRARPEMLAYFYENYAKEALNMTLEWGILCAINPIDGEKRDDLLARFAERFADNAEVMDKYFMLIAMSPSEKTLANVQAALKHPAFSIENPNKVRALFRSFSLNTPCFHAADGSGYRLLADVIGTVDKFNPQLGAGMAKIFSILPTLDVERQNLLRTILQQLMQDGLSVNTREIVSKILDN